MDGERRTRGDRDGFTLIELLVVVAVIGILASLIMPSVVNALRQATATNCQSNLKQIVAASIVYSKEHSMLIVTTRNPTGGLAANETYTYWPDTLEPIVRDFGIFRCPGKDYAERGYGQNYRVLGGINSSLSLWHGPQSMDMVRNPSGTVLFADTAYITNRDDPPHDWIEHRSAVTRGYLRARIESYTAYDTDPWRAVGRHPAHKANGAFFDGHTDGIDIAELYAPMYGDPDCLLDNQ
jgi:prepilin-type N-terminal cleavage/methylation domain-containing protein/prepilin-type processing-associated H-X9-DG protein